jgi:hypothetical protein
LVQNRLFKQKENFDEQENVEIVSVDEVENEIMQINDEIEELKSSENISGLDHTCVPGKMPGFKFEFRFVNPNPNLNLKICKTCYQNSMFNSKNPK